MGKLRALPVLMAMMLFGCSSGSRTGGEFTGMLSADPANLDPQMASDEASYNVIRNIYATLVDTDNEGMIRCYAADDYHISDDGLEYIFYLRSGIMWKGEHDPVPLTADDYVFAYERLMDPVTNSPHKDMFADIKTIYAVDEKTLVIDLYEPNCDFLKKMAHPAFSPCNRELFLSTEGRYGMSAEDTYACGAFYISEWNYDPYWVGNHITLTKIRSNSFEGFVTSPDTVDLLIEPEETPDICVYEGGEVAKGYKLSDAYYPGLSLLVFTDKLSDDMREQLFAVACGAGDTSDDEHRRAYAYVPPSMTVMNQNYRDIFPDSRGYVRSIADTAEGFDKELFHAMLIPDDYTSYDTINRIIDMFAECGYYCDPMYLEEKELDERIGTGYNDLYVFTVKADLNSVDDLFAKIYSECGLSDNVLYYLSSQSEVSAKAKYSDQLENMLINEKVVLPLTYESVRIQSRNDISDYRYDPFVGTFNYKYMTGEK